MEYKTITRHCKQCGQQLKLRNTRDIERKWFCSHACKAKFTYFTGRNSLDEARKRAYTPEAIRKRNLPKGPKACKHCGQTYDPDSARQGYCKVCAPDGQARKRMYLYGISKPEWDAMLEQQGNKCALCDVFPTAVDHCHTTGKVRGLLCHCCNMVLARVESGWYERAASYLDRAS